MVADGDDYIETTTMTTIRQRKPAKKDGNNSSSSWGDNDDSMQGRGVVGQEITHILYIYSKRHHFDAINIKTILF